MGDSTNIHETDSKLLRLRQIQFLDHTTSGPLWFEPPILNMVESCEIILLSTTQSVVSTWLAYWLVKLAAKLEIKDTILTKDNFFLISPITCTISRLWVYFIYTIFKPPYSWMLHNFKQRFCIIFNLKLKALKLKITQNCCLKLHNVYDRLVIFISRLHSLVTIE